MSSVLALTFQDTVGKLARTVEHVCTQTRLLDFYTILVLLSFRALARALNLVSRLIS